VVGVEDATVLGAVVEAAAWAVHDIVRGCNGSGRKAVGDAAEKEPRGSSGRRSPGCDGSGRKAAGDAA
jgi:hypothetical protein